MWIKRHWVHLCLSVGIGTIIFLDSPAVLAYQVTNIPIEARPTYTTVSPDGKKAYVSVWPGSSLYIFDTSNYAPPEVINLGFTPGPAEFSPDGSRIYFTGYHSNLIRLFDPTSKQIVSTISAPSQHIDNIALSPDGKNLYVGQNDTNTTLVLDSITGAQKGSLPFAMEDMVFLPDGSKAYAVPREYSPYSLLAIDTSTYQTSELISFLDGKYPYALGIDSLGSSLFVERHAVGGISSTLTTIDTATNTLKRTDILLGNYFAVSITTLPDGSYVYAPATGSGSGEGPGGGDFLSIVNIATGEVSQLTVGYRPYDLEILPDGSRIYLANNGSANVSIIETGYEPAPEPATMLLLGSGLAGLAGFRKRFGKKD